MPFDYTNGGSGGSCIGMNDDCLMMRSSTTSSSSGNINNNIGGLDFQRQRINDNVVGVGATQLKRAPAIRRPRRLMSIVVT